MSCLLIFVIAVGLLTAVVIFVLPAFIADITQMASLFPNALHDFAVRMAEKFPAIKDVIMEKVAAIKSDLAGNISADAIWKGAVETLKTLKTATGGAVAFCSFCAAFAVAPIYLYYLLVSNFDFTDFVEKKLDFVGDGAKSDIVFFMRRFSDIMSAFFRGQIAVALIMALLLGTGFAVCGIKFGFILGFCAGMINIIPYVGTVVGLGTVLPVAFFQDGGGIWLAVAALGVFCAVQLLEGYVLTPRIMGSRTGLHPAVIIFSVFFWGIALNGIIGMILAIPLTALIAAGWDRISARIRQLTL